MRVHGTSAMILKAIPLVTLALLAGTACKQESQRYSASGRGLDGARDLSSQDARGSKPIDRKDSDTDGDGDGTDRNNGSGPGNDSGSANTTGSGSGNTTGSGSGNSSGNQPNQNSGTGGTGGSTTTNPTPTPTARPEDPFAEPVSYPVYTFMGRGTITNEGRTYNTESSVTTEVSATWLRNNITAMRIIVPNNQDRGDRAARELLGTRTYNRPSNAEMTTATQSQGFHRATYVVFAKDVVRGTSVTTFSRPLPVFPWTGKRSRYNELDAGPRTWTAMINNQFEAQVTVSKVSEAGSIYTMRIAVNIPSDRFGERYRLIRIPKEATYEIDTTTREVRRVRMTEWFENEDDRNEREQSTTNLGVCTVTQDGKTSTHTCP